MQVDRALLNQLEKMENDLNDEYTMFCLSLAPKLRRLNPEQYENVQIRILQAIREQSRQPVMATPAPQQQHTAAQPQTTSYSGYQPTTNFGAAF